MNIRLPSDERKAALEQIKRVSENGDLYIWGSSYTAKFIVDYIYDNISVETRAYVVDDTYYTCDYFEGKPVIKASEWWRSHKSGDIVVFGHTHERIARSQMSKMPSNINAYYFVFPYFTLHYNDFMNESYIEEHKHEIDNVFNMMNDDISKAIMTSFIASCVTGNTEELSKYSKPDQYFNELTRSIKKGIFVDMGAYIGDTIEDAVKVYGDKIDSIVAFEPEEKNYTELKKRVYSIFSDDVSKIKILQEGSWSEKKILTFSDGCSSSSRIEENGSIKVNVDSLDNILSGNEKNVSFLKLDVEGSELESLKGSEKAIKRYHPTIAVCIYHRIEDIYRIPLWINETVGNSGYKYYMRYHDDCLTELVFYAIPD